MMALSTAARLRPAAVGDVANQDGDESPIEKRVGDLTFYLVGVGTVALIATCIRVWAGMDVIQTQINGLSKSDTQQNVTIEALRSEVNNLRVQVGILRATSGQGIGGRP
jgi:hypothetical protein